MVTELTLQGRTFRIRPFKAKDGSFIAFKVAGLLGPLFSKLPALTTAGAPADGGASESAQMVVDLLPALGAITQGLSEADFDYLQGKCLGAIDEQLSGGNWVPILQLGGNAFGVPGLEENTPLVLMLTVRALATNLSGFFAEGGLSGLLGGLSLSPQSSPPT